MRQTLAFAMGPFAIFLICFNVVFAVQISVPSAPGAGFYLVSTTSGQYLASSTATIVGGRFVATSTLASYFPYASSTALTTTSLFFSGIASALLGTDVNGKVVATTSIGANLLAGTIGNAQLANSSFLTSLNSTLTGDSSVNLGGTFTLSVNLTNPNTWTGLQKFAGPGTTTIANGMYADQMAARIVMATSTTNASQIPLASTTAVTATTLCLTGDTCRTTWPTAGSAGGDPFFHQTPTQSSTSTGLTILASTTVKNLVAYDPNSTSTFAGPVTIASVFSIGSSSPMPASALTLVGTTTFVGPVNHYGTVFCGSGGLYGLGLLGDEWCGNDNTDTGGIQRIVANNSNGTKAWSGYTLNNDRADATLSHFAGIYYNSCGYTSTFYGTAYGVPCLALMQNTEGPLTFFTGTSTKNVSGTQFSTLYISFGTGSTNAAEERMRIIAKGQIGVGTTTPFWNFTIASSTGPQLALVDTNPANFAWTMRSINNNLYVATSTALATSSIPGMVITSNNWTGHATSAPGSQFSIGNVANFSSATTTLYGTGINMASGCFAVAGVCITGGGGGSPGGSGTELQYRSGASTFGAVTPSSYDSADGDIAFGTTTSGTTNVGVLISGSSTEPQLVLSDNVAADPLWVLRNSGGVLAFASSTQASTSTMQAFTLYPAGKAVIGIGAPNSLAATFQLYEQNGVGQSPSMIWGGNTGGDTDYWIARNSDNDGVDNDRFQIGANSTPGNNILMTMTNSGMVAFSTTTPKFGVVTVGSSTVPQIMLTDNNPANFEWALRSSGNVFTISTSTATATSSVAALTIQSGRGLFIGTTTNSNATGIASNGTVFLSGISTASSAQTGDICINAANEIINDSAVCIVSSRRFKQDIHDLSRDEALDLVMHLNPVSYFYKPDFNGAKQSDPNYNGEQVGLIAEDVQSLDPRLVTVEADGQQAHSVRYENLTAILTAALQAQQEQINHVKRSTEENWQWVAILSLMGMVIYQQRQIRRTKKYE